MPAQRTRPPRVRPVAPADVSPGFAPLAVAVLALAVPLMIVLIVVAAVIPTVPWWAGVLVALAVAGLAVWQRLRSAHDVVVEELLTNRGSVSSVRLTNMVHSLALVVGIEEPEAFVLDTDAVNALIAARNDVATLFVTRGLDERLEPVELEAVVAELLVRLRSGDAEAATIGAALYRLRLLGPLSNFTIGRTASLGLATLLADERDLAADQQAVALTRYPPALSSALSKVKDQPRRPADLGGECDLLWLVSPDPAAAPGATRSPLDLRIDVLTEL
ncbi:MAG: hypothetical protein OEZ14_13190 [Acidimicrobiia bacterium]|nr:hypothetical protein [Acidimicrobiia bacterium]